MLNILMTDALIESVNKHIRNKVLPIAPCLPDDDSMRRRPYSSDESRHMSGFNTRGVAYPLKTFGKLPATSNVGVPLFDGRGSVWLIRDGIAVVFEDASVYYIIKNDELHHWFVSEVHNALLDEYNRLTMVAEEGDIPVPTVAVESNTATVHDTSSGDVHFKWDARPTPITTDDIMAYFTQEQYCEPLLVPTHGDSLHYRTMQRMLAYLRTLSTAKTLHLRTFPTYKATTHSEHIGCVYAMLHHTHWSFIHLLTELDIVSTSVSIDFPNISDIFLITKNGDRQLLFVSKYDTVHHLCIDIEVAHVLDFVSLLKHQPQVISNSDVVDDWVSDNM